jgi:hypothetical protein
MVPSFRSANTQGRRAALRRLTAFLLAGAAGIKAGYGNESKNQQALCVNLNALKTCSGCTYFTPGAEGAACGQCLIFNGPANPHGRCDDWTARSA